LHGTLNHVEDKPGTYWDYRECGWVKCPAPANEVALRAPGDAVIPAQDRPAGVADAADATTVGTSQ
jgi:hypothetical protein